MLIGAWHRDTLEARDEVPKRFRRILWPIAIPWEGADRSVVTDAEASLNASSALVRCHAYGAHHCDHLKSR